MNIVAYIMGTAVALIINTFLLERSRMKDYEFYSQVCKELVEINRKENKILEDLIHDNKLLKDQLDAKSSDCIHCPYVSGVRTGSSPWTAPYPEGTH